MNQNLRYLFLPLLLGACNFAPDYQRPALDTPSAYKEAGDWQVAAQTFTPPEKWWQAFGDPVLNDLEEQVSVDNQNIQIAAAQYRAARAAVDSASASLWPNLGVNASASRGVSASVTPTGASIPPTNLYSLSAQANWEVDLWGRIRNGIDVASANAQAAAATVGAARLSAQALLAQSYFQLRAAEAQVALYERTVIVYERFLQLTENRRTAGVASSLDVAQAQTQLENARTQYAEARLQRAQYEHALATLLGKPPAALVIPVAASDRLVDVPSAPALLPSTVLERRYDIYAAERQVAAANAQIGVARAAWFPVLNLSANGGYRNDAIAKLISLPNRFWSAGPALAATLFDAGARSAAIEQAWAGVDQAAANYRQTVLVAFQEVEDNLAAAHLLAEESVSQDAALAAARKSREIAENQYRVGIITALNVITAQTSELAAENATLSLWNRRMAAATTLLKNTGGRPLTAE
jgi:NodT family efflux transporter outer membrane factor (OMF) lipoprotein